MTAAELRHRVKGTELFAVLGIVGAAAFTGAVVVRWLRSGARSASSEPVRLFEISTEIERPPEEVFAFVAALRNDLQWGQRVIKEVRQTSEGSLGVGTRFLQVGRFLGLRFEIPINITQYEPGRKFGFEAAIGPLRGTGLRSVEATAIGTRLTITTEGYPDGFSRFLLPIFAYWGEREVRTGLANLKDLLESGNPEEAAVVPARATLLQRR
jgi:hypothetical protein